MRSVVLASLCGLASAAAAQSGSFSIVPSIATIDFTVSTSFTLAIFADADFGTHIVGGEIALEGFFQSDLVTDMVGESAAWGNLGENDRGYAGNGDYAGLVFGQLVFPPFIPPSAESALGNGSVFVGTISVTVPTNMFFSVGWTGVGGLGDFALEVYDDADGSFTQLTADQVDFGSASIQVIPSAPSGALLGIAGLVALRRRR